MILAWTPSLWSQDTADGDAVKTLAKQWRDLLHYIRIGQQDMAQSFAKAILASGAKPRQIYLLSVETHGSLADLARGARLGGMKVLVDKITALIEKGYEDERSDPDQIGRSIAMLGKSEREARIGAARLVRSGEYGLPQLVQKLADAKTSIGIREKIVGILPRIGRQGVRAMSVALQSTEPRVIEAVAGALGRIEYPHAAPQLRQLLERKGLLPRTKRIVRAALLSCGGKGATEKSLAQLYYELALKYYYRSESVLPDSRYAFANVWRWRNDRLEYTPVPRPIFCDIYAMRYCRIALGYDGKFHKALSLWLGAYLKREANLPTGAKDPLAPKEPAKFFALASNARYVQDALGRALRDRDTVVVLNLIEALARTAGAETLVQPVSGGVNPLVEALRYPNRRVQVLAALSLARALPRRRFTGSEMVVDVLKSALRLSGKKRAILVVAQQDLRNKLKDAIRAAGYELVDEPDPNKALVAARGAKGVDVIVLSDSPRAVGVIRDLRRDPRLAITPVVVVSGSSRTATDVKDDKYVVVIAPDADAGAVAGAMSAAGKLSGVGPFDQAEAGAWAVEVAKAIRMLGLTKNGVFNILRTQDALLEALADKRGNVRVAAANALAVLTTSKAQAGIAALAVDSAVDEKIRIAAYKALSESARKSGGNVSDELADAIVAVVIGDGSQVERQAAAEALAALGLSSEKSDAMILKTSEND